MAASAEVTARLEPIMRRMFAEPDGSTISDMLQAAEGTFEERFAWIVPSIKIIITGGMQEPGHSAGSTVLGLLTNPDQAAELAADPGRAGAPGGGGRAALDLADRHPDAAGHARHRAGRDRRARRRQHRAAGVVGQPRSGGVGRQTPTCTTSTGPSARMRPSGLGRTSARASPRPDAGAARDPGAVRALPQPPARPRAAAPAARLGVSCPRPPARRVGHMSEPVWHDAAGDDEAEDGTLVELTVDGEAGAARARGRRVAGGRGRLHPRRMPARGR